MIKRTFRIVDFVVSADHRVKPKENKKREKYLDLAIELKRLRNMKIAVLPILIGTMRTVFKALVRGLNDLEIGRRFETIQTIALPSLARILRRVLVT